MNSQPNTNKLINESSPYLLQHAHNPVDWYPWGEDALHKAQVEDKPIIVSIGYSACHWCHVMERESFENKAVADLMNAHFICIKVDREERPDVDQIYMEAIQAMGIQGGWPLNVFLTAEQKPFYGGTYFPRDSWKQLLQNVAEAYENQREALVESAEKFTEALNFSEIEKYRLNDNPKLPDKADFAKISQKLAQNFDPKKGGMKNAPKFPMPAIWHFLLYYISLNNDETAKKQLALTLEKMASGGIYDQIGGGFSRYAVDDAWFAPHFEKMLYDNGQLVSLYAEAYRYFKNDLYKKTVYQTLDFLEQEMTNPEGGFYAALDADSEGEEGKFYTWTWEELQETLGEDAGLLASYFGATREGNWEKGQNILHIPHPLPTFLPEAGLSEEIWEVKLNEARKKLWSTRATRIRPGLDDKILTGWNGIMLKGIIDAYVTFKEEKFLNLALKNAHFIKDKLFIDDHTLCRTYKEGKASLNGYLEDYAHVIRAVTALYQVTFIEDWLNLAKQLTEYVLQNFYDEKEKLFFFTDANTALIARKKEVFDNVIPASNSVMAQNLYELSVLLDREDWRIKAENMVMKVKKLIIEEPRYMSNWATVLLKVTYPTAEVVTVGPEAEKTPVEFGQYPIYNVVFAGTKNMSFLPLLKKRTAINNKTTIYVCYGRVCKLPVHAIDEAVKQINI